MELQPKPLPRLAPWEERKPFLEEGFLHVPRFYEGHTNYSFPLFTNSNPVAIEYCSGNGEWIIEKSLENPGINWIAVERKLVRAKQIFQKRERAGLKNLLIVHADAEDFTKHYLSEGMIFEMFINFPDPWPKKKHQKNRLIKEPFIQDMARVIKKGCFLTVVTDDEKYSDQVIKEVTGNRLWRAFYDLPFYVTTPEDYGLSFFYRLWKSKGKEIRYMKFIREEA